MRFLPLTQKDKTYTYIEDSGEEEGKEEEDKSFYDVVCWCLVSCHGRNWKFVEVGSCRSKVTENSI